MCAIGLSRSRGGAGRMLALREVPQVIVGQLIAAFDHGPSPPVAWRARHSWGPLSVPAVATAAAKLEPWHGSLPSSGLFCTLVRPGSCPCHAVRAAFPPGRSGWPCVELAHDVRRAGRLRLAAYSHVWRVVDTACSARGLRTQGMKTRGR